jgi:hypothetical protein
MPAWWLASAGVEAQQRVTVGRAGWTVCYKIHVIPSRKPRYEASITLWPKARRRLTSRDRSGGWNARLVRSGWYDRASDELRRHGYRGKWQWSPWGRFGDFWKSFKSIDALAVEARRLERLRTELRLE